MLINSKIDEIKDMFGLFDDPMDKYTQIIELGKKNTPLKDKDKNDTNRIYGCTSLAWVKVIKEGHTYSILVDSDTFMLGQEKRSDFAILGKFVFSMENSETPTHPMQ